MKIGKINLDDEIYVIAEIGGNHDGNVEKALLLIEQAALAGVNCAKFQIYKTEELFSKDSSAYPAVLGHKTQFERQKSIELPIESFKILADKCRSLGIDFSASAWSEEAIDYLVDELKAPFIKVGSGDITSIPLLRHMAKKKVPIALSTAGCSLDHIKEAVEIIGNDNLILMHCTLPYPTENKDVNLLRILELKKEFKTLVGYSDHTTTNDACIGACYLGACIIEKHFASNNGSKQTGDHKVSAEVESMKELVKLSKRARLQLGSPSLKYDDLSEDAKVFGIRLRRALVAAEDIKKGDVLSKKNLSMRRPEDKGIPAFEWDNVLGKKTNCNIKKGSFITSKVLEN